MESNKSLSTEHYFDLIFCFFFRIPKRIYRTCWTNQWRSVEPLRWRRGVFLWHVNPRNGGTQLFFTKTKREEKRPYKDHFNSFKLSIIFSIGFEGKFCWNFTFTNFCETFSKICIRYDIGHDWIAKFSSDIWNLPESFPARLDPTWPDKKWFFYPNLKYTSIDYVQLNTIWLWSFSFWFTPFMCLIQSVLKSLLGILFTERYCLKYH